MPCEPDGTRVFELPDDPAATERLGAEVGARLQPGDTIALQGGLGAGKTTFTRGLARGLGLDDPEGVASPTYLLVIEHGGPIPLLHADAYLPEKLAGFLADGGLEYLFDPAKVVVVEWPENVRKHLPDHVLWVELSMPPRPGRTVRLRPQGPRGFPWLADLPRIDEPH
ncbi:MAG TPA: tRNA (adenosine(37)-N6)-threonylcarbamoyltransferase complex ATPase subunit type 1 TsaE [bacterium]|nr:tRNA (adenosine(37)-N6)-threonylcarbamoyltransferase complex ATPase subunit type 1 TsaE [bacterium]